MDKIYIFFGCFFANVILTKIKNEFRKVDLLPQKKLTTPNNMEIVVKLHAMIPVKMKKVRYGAI